jgi:hypothetical protein
LKRKNKGEKEASADATPCKPEPECPQVSEASSDPQGMTCPNNRCGKVFDKPLELIDLAKPSDKGSYVCPYCLSKLEATKLRQEIVIETFSAERPQDVAEQKEGKCPQFIGYLGKRPKNVPIPDFCLTCPQMMKCLLG